MTRPDRPEGGEPDAAPDTGPSPVSQPGSEDLGAPRAGAAPVEVPVRALSTDGIARFAAYLAALREGSCADPPGELLDHPRLTAEAGGAASVVPGPFASRWGLARHLSERLGTLAPEDVDDNVGLWAWLALFYFDQTCPRLGDGTRKPGRDYRHIPDFGFLYRHRHLLYGPFAVYRRHGGYAILVLSGPLHREGGVYQEITSRQDMLASRGVIEALNALYLDRGRGGSKRGAQGKTGAPGTIRRFVRVLQQLDVTYDICGMSGQAILELLPAEFAPWQPAASPARATASPADGGRRRASRGDRA